MKTPADKVRDAMPGTIADLASRTGYPEAEIHRQIGNLRRTGTRIFARPGAGEQNELGIEYAQPRSKSSLTNGVKEDNILLHGPSGPRCGRSPLHQR